MLIKILVHLRLRISVCHIYALWSEQEYMCIVLREHRGGILPYQGKYFGRGRGFQVGKWLRWRHEGKWEMGNER